MNYGWVAGSALAVMASTVCAVYVNHGAPREGRQPLPWRITLIVFTVTALVTTLQFIQPTALELLQRDPAALRSGQLWRLVTPLFVQPAGLIQCVVNTSLLFIFMPAAERIYGKRALIVYFGAGIAGQIANYLWDSPLRGGSSTAIFGIMGGLLSYTLSRRGSAPRAVVAAALVGFMGGTTSIIFHDGHGCGLVAGATLGIICLRAAPRRPIGDIPLSVAAPQTGPQPN